MLLLLYAIKQVLDTNTETAEQWSHTAQSGHWAPNMRDPDETTQYLYYLYTVDVLGRVIAATPGTTGHQNPSQRRHNNTQLLSTL